MSEAGGRLESVGRTDSDSDQPFIEVVSKRAAKRKERGSPVDVEECSESDGTFRGRTVKKINMGGSANYSEAIGRPPVTKAAINNAHVAPSGNSNMRESGYGYGSVKITGRSLRPAALQAGERNRVEKITFCVSNVGENYSVNDIRQHCWDLNIKVLFCFDISSVTAYTRAFKLAVPATACDTIMDPESWPSRVIVRPWRSNRGDYNRREGLRGEGLREGDEEQREQEGDRDQREPVGVRASQPLNGEPIAENGLRGEFDPPPTATAGDNHSSGVVVGMDIQVEGNVEKGGEATAVCSLELHAANVMSSVASTAVGVDGALQATSAEPSAQSVVIPDDNQVVIAPL